MINKKKIIILVFGFIFLLIGILLFLLFGKEALAIKRDERLAQNLVVTVKFALENQSVEKDVSLYMRENNVSCYIDKDDESGLEKDTDWHEEGEYSFDDDLRMSVGVPYYAAGNVNGMTLTFDGKVTNAAVNKYIDMGYEMILGYIGSLKNEIEDECGDEIVFKSKKYQNSEYTLFIYKYNGEYMVEGQWSGINLNENDAAKKAIKQNTREEQTEIKDQVTQTTEAKKQEPEQEQMTDNVKETNTHARQPKRTERVGFEYFESVNNRVSYSLKMAEYSPIYAYLSVNNELILRNSPRENMNDIAEEYGLLDEKHSPNWKNVYQMQTDFETVIVETKIQPINCYAWFHNARKLKRIVGIENIDTSRTVDMTAMFHGCNSLEALDLSKFDTSNVIAFEMMFDECYSLKELNLNNFDMSSAASICQMFNNCTSLEKLEVSKWNTENIELAEFVFADCEKLNSIDVSNWNMGKCFSFEGMFKNCKSLNTIDVEQWNISSLKNTMLMYTNCPAERPSWY